MLLLSHDSQVPLYVQLYDQIKKGILSGTLPSHSKLPSVRDLASQLSVSRNTVETAYLELHSEGYIYSKARSGYYASAVTDDLPLRPAPPKTPVRDSTGEGHLPCEFDFHPARLDPEAFPVQIWRKCLLDALRQSSRDLNHYCDPQGEHALRRHLQKYLEQSRGVVCDVDQIVICAGLQHGLDIVAHIMRDRRPVVAVEDPGYHLARSVFQNHSLRIVPIPVQADGMDPDALHASGCTVAYITPSHQFPTGCVMPIGNRLKLIQWAGSSGRLIIEDDYDSKLRYHGKPIPSLQGLDPGGNIVYSGTFSKVLSPALRVSYLVLPRSLLPVYRRHFKDYASSVSVLEQRTIARFMELGHWERHLRRMRTLYKKKHDALLHAVELHFGPSARVIGQGAGLHVVLQVGTDATEKELIELAATNGIELFPYSSTCCRVKAGATTFLLGFGGLSAERTAQGIELLYKSWNGRITGAVATGC